MENAIRIGTNHGSLSDRIMNRYGDSPHGMVESALEQLSVRGVVTLDEERKAQMVSNLLVVLCADREAQPVVNAGTLY